MCQTDKQATIIHISSKKFELVPGNEKGVQGLVTKYCNL